MKKVSMCGKIKNRIKFNKYIGIWKSEMKEGILIGNGETANLGGPVLSDPWTAMIDDHGDLPEEDDPAGYGKWNDERENSFQSVASSTRDKVQIRDLKTGQNITLNRDEVILKFREDRLNDECGFEVINMTTKDAENKTEIKNE